MPKEAPFGGGGEQNDGKTEYESGRHSWNRMCCLFDFLSVVPGVNQSLKADCTAGRGGTTSRPTASGPTDAWEDNGAHSVASLASPSKRWVSLRAGCWKGFVFGKGLQTSGDWAGKPPFKAGESQRGGTRFLGYCLNSAWQGQRGKMGK